MIKVITDDKNRVADWAAKHLKGCTWRDFYAMGYEREGKLIGAAIFDQFSGKSSNNDMHISVASVSHDCWTRKHLAEAFDYVWNQCKCARLTGLVSVSNRKSNKLIKGLGFTKEGVMRQKFYPEDANVWGLLKHECTWLER